MSSRDAAVLSTDDRRGCWFDIMVGPEIGHQRPKPSRSDSPAGPKPSKGPLIIFVFQERPERTHGGHQNHGCRYDNMPLEPSINGGATRLKRRSEPERAFRSKIGDF
jgi:hypothetical protein